MNVKSEYNEDIERNTAQVEGEVYKYVGDNDSSIGTKNESHETQQDDHGVNFTPNNHHESPVEVTVTVKPDAMDLWPVCVTLIAITIIAVITFVGKPSLWEFMLSRLTGE